MAIDAVPDAIPGEPPEPAVPAADHRVDGLWHRQCRAIFFLTERIGCSSLRGGESELVTLKT